MEAISQPAPFNVLLADDDIDDCGFFEEALLNFPLATNYNCVHNGEQLMNLLAGNEAVLPHVIFLDLNMPRKNGFECLEEIMLHSRLKLIPIIIYSTSLEKEVVNKLFMNGARYFIRKPSDFSKFIEIIQQALMLVYKNNTSHPLIEDFILTV